MAEPEHDGGPDEPEEYRERYRELLEELRTVLPGVQVLFAFLLSAPFTRRFGDLDDLGRDVYGASLLGVALSAVLLMTPAAFHRVSRPGRRVRRVRISVVLQVAGMTLLLLSMSAALFVVVRFLFESTPLGVAFGVGTGAVGLLLWYVLPLLSEPAGADDVR